MSRRKPIGGKTIGRKRSEIDHLFQLAIAHHQAKELQQAARLYQRLTQDSPDFSPAWVNLGMLHRQQGDDTAAMACYQRALALPNPPTELFLNCANLYLSRQRLNDAELLYRELLERQADHPDGLQQLARVLRDQGFMQQARKLFRQLLQHHPGHTTALLELGNLERALQNCAVALDCYQRLTEIDPHGWKGHYSIARVLLEHDAPCFDLAAGEAALQRALRLADRPADVLLPLARAAFSRGRDDEAQRLLERLLVTDSENQYALLDLARVLARRGERGRATEIFDRLSQSDDIVLLSRMAEIRLDLNEWQQSLQHLRRVVELEPERPDALFNLATAYMTAWHLDEALELIEPCRVSGVDRDGLLSLAGSIQMKRGSVEAALAAYRLEGGSWSRRAARLNFASLYSDRLSARDNFLQHRQMAALLEEGIEPRQSHANRPDPDRRLRLGYVSADLHHQHPVDIFMQPVFANHDRKQFELFIYYSGKGYDHRTNRARTLADRWLDVADWPDEQLVEQIVSDRIDLLIDLSGHTARNRLPVFARRPAPIQVSMVAYPHSTGMDSIDYFVGDPVLTPPEQAHLYSERLLLLDHSIFCYPADLHPVNPFRSRRRQVVFGSFNNIPKLTPTTIRLWGRILRQLPESMLLLKSPSFQDAGTVSRYLELFALERIGKGRILFRGPSALDQMMLEYNDIDIALDPVPFNGGTTSQQLLWAATPLVTLAGEGFSRRMGASILSHLGLDAWVAHSEEEYVRIAVGLASDREQLHQWHRRLNQLFRDSSLTDTVGYTRDLERHYRTVWRDWCRQQSASLITTLPVWQEMTSGRVAELVAFWQAERAIGGSVDLERRATEAVLLAVRGGAIIGVVTAERVRDQQGGGHFYNGRIYISRAERSLRLMRLMLAESFDLLQGHASKEQEALQGVLLRAENPKWKRAGVRRWLKRNGYRSVGTDQGGEELFLCLFS